MRVEDCWISDGWQTRSPSRSARVGRVEVAAGRDIYHLVYQWIQTCSLSARYRQVELPFALNEKNT